MKGEGRDWEQGGTRSDFVEVWCWRGNQKRLINVKERSKEEYVASLESFGESCFDCSLISWRIHQEETPDLTWKTIEDFQRDTEDSSPCV